LHQHRKFTKGSLASQCKAPQAFKVLGLAPNHAPPHFCLAASLRRFDKLLLPDSFRTPGHMGAGPVCAMWHYQWHLRGILPPRFCVMLSLCLEQDEYPRAITHSSLPESGSEQGGRKCPSSVTIDIDGLHDIPRPTLAWPRISLPMNHAILRCCTGPGRATSPCVHVKLKCICGMLSEAPDRGAMRHGATNCSYQRARSYEPTQRVLQSNPSYDAAIIGLRRLPASRLDCLSEVYLQRSRPNCDTRK